MVDIIRPNFGTVWAASGEKLSPTEIKIQGGWIQEMMPYQYQNFLQNRVDNAITYLLQKGVPEWDAAQEYTANKSVVTYSGQLYMAITTNTNVLPSVSASWKRLTISVGANGAIPVAFGGTGATSAGDARINLGLGTAALLDANTLVIKSGTGNAPAADKLTTARTITLTGGASGSVSFDGSSDQNLNVTGLNASSLNSGTVPNTVLSGAVLKTSATGSAIIPSGTVAERDSSPVEGFTRWNKTSKSLESWNGTTWVVSFGVDLGTMVGVGPTQVPNNSMLGSAAYVSKDIFVEKTLNYTTLRAYTGTAVVVQVTTEGIAGLFGSVSSGTENGGTLIQGADGRKWKRLYSGTAYAQWFGIIDGVNELSIVQTAFDSVNDLTISGITINVTGDILYKSNFTLYISKGSGLVLDAGRITPKTATVNNVEIIVDGFIRSKNLPSGAIQDGGPSGKFDWTVVTDAGKQYAERAFIEFGGTASSPTTGFVLRGAGVVSGDWVGTPATHTWDILALKGIGSWRSDNIRIAEVEVFGFRAECIYHEEQSRSANNIVFENLYVHDVGHNALNFNLAAIGVNCHIRNNKIKRSFQAIEASSGNIINNTAYDSVAHGLQTGGANGGSLEVVGNTFIGNGQEGIHVSFGEAWENVLDGKVIIRGNTTRDCGSAGIRCFGATQAVITNNSVDGFGTTYGVMCFSERGTDIGTVANNTIRGKGVTALGWLYTGGQGMRAFDNIVIRPGGDTVNISTYSGYQSPFSNVQNHSILSVPYNGFGSLSRYLVGTDAVGYGGGIFAEVGAIVSNSDGTNALGSYVIRTRKSDATNIPSDSLIIDSTGRILPGVDNAQLIGSAIKRWGNIYLGNNPIISSDARLKQNVEELSLAEKQVAIRLRNLIRTYKFKEAVLRKDSKARIHCGVIAQDVVKAFEEEGLDARDYALLCHDTWESSEEVVVEGVVIKESVQAGDRYSIRYEELILFIIASIQ